MPSFGLQFLHLNVRDQQPKHLAQRLRQQSSIVSAQAGLLQLRSHMLAPAAAEKAHASCLIGLSDPVRGYLLQAHALAGPDLPAHCVKEREPTGGAAVLPAPEPEPAAIRSAAAIAFEVSSQSCRGLQPALE